MPKNIPKWKSNLKKIKVKPSGEERIFMFKDKQERRSLGETVGLSSKDASAFYDVTGGGSSEKITITILLYLVLLQRKALEDLMDVVNMIGSQVDEVEYKPLWEVEPEIPPIDSNEILDPKLNWLKRYKLINVCEDIEILKAIDSNPEIVKPEKLQLLLNDRITELSPPPPEPFPENEDEEADEPGN